MDSFNQTFFTLETSLNQDNYQLMERQFQKENSKTFKIIHKNGAVERLHSFIIEEDEFMELFTSFKDNQLILQENLNSDLMKVIIPYFYFREIKPLSIKLIFDLLLLAIFLKLNELIKKIISFLNNNLTDAKKIAFIRKNLFPFTFLQTSNEEININNIFEECEIFLLKNSCFEDYLAFYADEYFSNSNNVFDVEQEFIKRLEIMNSYKIDSIYILRLFILFKDSLIKINAQKEPNFDFKLYAEKIVETFIKINEIDPKTLHEHLSKLELNTKDFKIKILSEKISYLENEVVTMKQSFNKEVCQLKSEAQHLKEVLRKENGSLLESLASMKNEIDNLKSEIQTIKGKIYTKSIKLEDYRSWAIGGYVFDIEAKTPLTITEICCMAREAGSWKVSLFYRMGSFEGYEENSAEWNFLGERIIQFRKKEKAEIIPIKLELQVEREKRISFYISNDGNESGGQIVGFQNNNQPYRDLDDMKIYNGSFQERNQKFKLHGGEYIKSVGFLGLINYLC